MVMIITIVLCALYERSQFIVSCIETDIDTQIRCKYYDKLMSYSLRYTFTIQGYETVFNEI